jgi:SAM-dependent methyltransferase
MALISDSTSVYEEQRQFPQHQAVLSLVRQVTDNPALHAYRWLDLGCGQGQVVAQMADNLPLTSRSKIEYYGIDGKKEYVEFCAGKAALLGLRRVECRFAMLADIGQHLGKEAPFELITLINVAHELDPFFLPRLIFEALIHLSPEGVLFVYDMEALEDPELGAILWSKGEIQELLSVLVRGLNGLEYCPAVAQWHHSKVNAWSFEFQRRLVPLPTSVLEQNGPRAVEMATHAVTVLIERKYRDCKALLDSLVEQESASQSEQETKRREVYNFYALSRAKERFPG